MTWYRRWRQPGGWFFFTLVTYQRQPILTSPLARDSLRGAMDATRCERPFRLFSIALLGDHLHCVWNLPENDSDYSTRWRIIKARFTRNLLATGYEPIVQNQSLRKRGGQGIWQRRFWEHTIRNENDLKRHVDYIHYNPVKHGYVSKAGDWEYSTFRRFVDKGEYPEDWGQAEPDNLRNWDFVRE